jgi:hypothetical protein
MTRYTRSSKPAGDVPRVGVRRLHGATSGEGGAGWDRDALSLSYRARIKR